jgi:hypothetical protein
MSTTDSTVTEPVETDPTVDENPAVESTDQPAQELDQEAKVTLELSLSEAEALRTWLLKPAGDGTTSLDHPLVSRALAELGRVVDAVAASVNVRRELQQAGLSVEHLSDEDVRELGRRVAEAATPGVRA